MKTLLTRVMVAFAAITLLFACGQDDNGENVKPEFELHLNLKYVTSTTVRISVTHNFEANKSWFGVFTTDCTSSGMQIINEALAEGVNPDDIHRSKQYVVYMENLAPSTNYRYVAMGVNDYGETYGSVSILEFKTLDDSETPGPDENGMMENEAWRVRYVGSAEVSGQIFDHVVRVSSSDTNPYVITVVENDKYNPQYMRELGNDFIDDMTAYLEEFNQSYGTNYTIADMLFRGDGADAFNLVPGVYRAVAIGVNADGTLSGLYATSDEFEVKEPVASDAYLSWLGEWHIEGQNGATDTITLSRGVANTSYTMTGWEGIEDLPVVVEYNAELNSIFFKSQLVAEHYYVNADYPDVNIYFFAGDDDGYYYDNSNGEYYIAIGGILDDGTRAIVRYGVNVPDYPKFVQMFYMAECDGEFYGLSAEADVPSFIAFMLPPTEATASIMQMPISKMRTTHARQTLQLIER